MYSDTKYSSIEIKYIYTMFVWRWHHPIMEQMKQMYKIPTARRFKNDRHPASSSAGHHTHAIDYAQKIKPATRFAN